MKNRIMFLVREIRVPRICIRSIDCAITSEGNRFLREIKIHPRDVIMHSIAGRKKSRHKLFLRRRLPVKRPSKGSGTRRR